MLTPRQNLFPVQIENALTAHSDIHEAAAVAVPDPTFGEVVGAWIVRSPGSNMSREDVRRVVSESMNPQVRFIHSSCQLEYELSHARALEFPCLGLVRKGRHARGSA
jgi:acyl-CoA synthetase (AMP-forming)/AMP-acid ligase II